MDTVSKKQAHYDREPQQDRAAASGNGFDVPVELPFSPPGQVINPMETWYFQVWYRDQLPPLPNPGSSANFSNMAEATFP